VRTKGIVSNKEFFKKFDKHHQDMAARKDKDAD